MPPQDPLHLSLFQGAHYLDTGAAHKAAQAGALSERGDAVVSEGSRGGMDGGGMAAVLRWSDKATKAGALSERGEAVVSEEGGEGVSGWCDKVTLSSE